MQSASSLTQLHVAVRQSVNGIFSNETRLHGMQFKPRSSDIIVTGAPKCGTTWLQQIIHQLRTGGDVEFSEMMDVVPMIEAAHDMHVDLYADQKAAPRCFKCLFWYPRCPKGARYIWCLREPCSAAYSFFHMAQGWFFQPGEVPLDEFVEHVWLKNGVPQKLEDLEGYFVNLASWWPHRNDPNVLVVVYEDLKESYEPMIRKIAEFMNICDEVKIRAALEKSTFEYMKKHADKFDQKTFKQNMNKNCGLSVSAGEGHSKIRTGSSTEGSRMLSAKSRQLIQQKWEAIVTPVTGCANYAELREACKNI